jgi:hypothetical protein
MKAIATIRLTIDIEGAKAMGLEISDPEEYAIEEMIEWVYEMNRFNSLGDCIHVELVEGEK